MGWAKYCLHTLVILLSVVIIILISVLLLHASRAAYFAEHSFHHIDHLQTRVVLLELQVANLTAAT